LRVNAQMARRFGADAGRFRKASAKALAVDLGVRVPKEDSLEHADFCNFAMVLSLVSELKSWTAAEKRGVVEIIRAKSGRDEMRYMRLLQGHDKLCAAVLKLGTER